MMNLNIISNLGIYMHIDAITIDFEVTPVSSDDDIYTIVGYLKFYIKENCFTISGNPNEIKKIYCKIIEIHNCEKLYFNIDEELLSKPSKEYIIVNDDGAQDIENDILKLKNFKIDCFLGVDFDEL